MLRTKKNNLGNSQRGDTLVEVLLSTVVLSVVLAGAYTLSNRATRINQISFDRTQATNIIQRQAELVRSARDSYNSSGSPDQLWDQIRAMKKNTIASIDDDCNDLSIDVIASERGNVFSIGFDQPDIVEAVAIRDAVYRTWIEVTQEQAGYYDVHIFACWEAAGTAEIQKSAVILRLEENND